MCGLDEMTATTERILLNLPIETANDIAAVSMSEDDVQSVASVFFDTEEGEDSNFNTIEDFELLSDEMVSDEEEENFFEEETAPTSSTAIPLHERWEECAGWELYDAFHTYNGKPATVIKPDYFGNVTLEQLFRLQFNNAWLSSFLAGVLTAGD